MKINLESAEFSTSKLTFSHEPLITIRPSRRCVALNLRELWLYRELLFFLAWRDVKVRYKQTALGVSWAIIQPLLQMLIFSLFFGELAGMPSDGVAYPVFAYAGLLPWIFFANAMNSSGNSLVGSANLISKVYFPRMIVPAATVVAGLIDFMVAFALVVPLMVYYKIMPTWSFLALPMLVAMVTALALGVGMWMSALNVKYRDVRYALPFLVQIWMFASPVIYPASIVPLRWLWLLRLNPMTGVLEGFRWALLSTPLDLPSLGTSILITIGVIVYAAYDFRRIERTFADIV